MRLFSAIFAGLLLSLAAQAGSITLYGRACDCAYWDKKIDAHLKAEFPNFAWSDRCKDSYWGYLSATSAQYILVTVNSSGTAATEQVRSSLESKGFIHGSSLAPGQCTTASANAIEQPENPLEHPMMKSARGVPEQSKVYAGTGSKAAASAEPGSDGPAQGSSDTADSNAAISAE